MNKIPLVSFLAMILVFSSCQNNSSAPVKQDSSAKSSPDSAANNGILPPSADPGNANNSSLADTTYKAKDSIKSKK